MPDTQKGTWTLQQTRDQILKNCWTYTGPPVSGGNAFVWGNNCDGQLGLGDRALRSSPTQLPGTWQCVAMGTYHALGIKSDGTLWSWGRNDRGQLGLGDFVTRSSPVQVGGLNDWCSIRIEGFDQQSAAQRTNNTTWVWGSEAPYGQLGLNSVTVCYNSPVQLPGTWQKGQVHLTGYFNLGVKSDCTMWFWGYGVNGYSGGGGGDCYVSSPVQIPGTTWCQVTAATAVRTDNSMWAWGEARFNSLGDGANTSRSSPVQIGSGQTWCCARAQQYINGALTTDNKLYTWGYYGISGFLGLNDIIARSLPTQVPGAWCRLAVNCRLMTGIKTDGTMWTWGENTGDPRVCGSLGLGDFVSRSSPTQIPGSWCDVTGVYWSTAAIKCV